jgi:hypothetical protein
MKEGITTWTAKTWKGKTYGPFTVPVKIEECGETLRLMDGYRDLQHLHLRNETGFVPEPGDRFVEVVKTVE